jgi:hypothetical protein
VEYGWCDSLKDAVNILIKEVLPEQIIFISGWDEEKNKIENNMIFFEKGN